MPKSDSLRTTERHHIPSRLAQVFFVGLLTCWCCLLLVGVFASSVTALMHLSSVTFHRSEHPDWTTFFWMDFYGHINNRGWIITKFGHFAGFGILEILMTLSFRKPALSSILAFLFAVLTELLQIPFGRDGRLYDVCIDTLGIVGFALFFESFKRQPHHQE